MRFPPRSAFAALPLRALCVALSLSAYLIGAVGIPLPSPPRKDRSRPFPCMDHACGCSDADECWHHCCCFDAAGKLAWAAEHHVTPPTCAVEAAHAAHHHATSIADVGQRGAKAAACCETKHARHAHLAASAERHTNTSSASKPSGASRFVIVAAMRHCRGGSSVWQAVSAALPPPPVAEYACDVTEAGDVALCSYRAVARHFPPPDPPPRG